MWTFPFSNVNSLDNETEGWNVHIGYNPARLAHDKRMSLFLKKCIEHDQNNRVADVFIGILQRSLSTKIALCPIPVKLDSKVTWICCFSCDSNAACVTRYNIEEKEERRIVMGLQLENLSNVRILAL